MVVKVKYMEKNLDAYIRKLIELDRSAVVLKKERDAELLELEARNRNMLKNVDELLDKAALTARQKHNEIVETAKKQAKEMDEAAIHMIGELQTTFASFREDAARDIWRQLLDIER